MSHLSYALISLLSFVIFLGTSFLFWQKKVAMVWPIIFISGVAGLVAAIISIVKLIAAVKQGTVSYSSADFWITVGIDSIYMIIGLGALAFTTYLFWGYRNGL